MKNNMKYSWALRKFDEEYKKRPSDFPKPVKGLIPVIAYNSIRALAFDIADKGDDPLLFTELIEAEYRRKFKAT